MLKKRLGVLDYPWNNDRQMILSFIIVPLSGCSFLAAVYPVYPVKDVIVSPNTHSDDTYLLTINGQAGTDGPADNHAPGSVLNGINGLNGAFETGSDDDLEDPFQ